MPERAPAIHTVSRVLDFIAIVSLLLGVTIFFTGGFREWTPWGRISLTSWVRPVFIALAVIAVRHWLQPRPTIATRVGLWVTRVRIAAEFRTVLPIVIGTRAGDFLVGFLAIVLLGYRADVPVPWRIYQNEILNLPARWDTGWYLAVAIDGYYWNPAWASEQQNIAFFPAYPMLMRYGSLLLGRETMWTGVLIAWVSFFGALVYLFKLARERLGEDAASATIALISAYPFAFFFSTAYTESLFLLALVGACYHFERDELWQAGLWGLTAGLTRPNGCLLSIVLALMAIGPIWPDWRVWRPIWPPPMGWSRLAARTAAAAAPGIGMLIYSTYIYFLTGNPLQWAVQNAAWGRVYRGLGTLIAQHGQRISDHGLYEYAATRTIDAIQVVAVLFMLVTVVPIYRRFGVPYAAMIVVNIIPPLLMGGLLSMGRLTSVLFPTFLWLGAAVPVTHRPSWLAVFAMLQALCAAVFFTWRPLY